MNSFWVWGYRRVFVVFLRGYLRVLGGDTVAVKRGGIVRFVRNGKKRTERMERYE